MDKQRAITHPGKHGKHKAKKDPRNLNISRFINRQHLTAIPDRHDWTRKKKTAWGVMKNKKLNNCTCVAAGHMIKCWTINATQESIIKDAEIINAYIELSGYNAQTGENDTGVAALDALKYWRKTGIGNHKIKAFATIDHDDHEIVRTSIYLFGGIYAGLQLPNTILGQKIWDIVPGSPECDTEPGSFGGHAVTILAYDAEHLTCVSWGVEKKMTWQFWNTYCDEVYAIITHDFFANDNSPTGLSLHQLEDELMKITGQKIRLQKQLEEDRAASLEV